VGAIRAEEEVHENGHGNGNDEVRTNSIMSKVAGKWQSGRRFHFSQLTYFSTIFNLLPETWQQRQQKKKKIARGTYISS